MPGALLTFRALTASERVQSMHTLGSRVCKEKQHKIRSLGELRLDNRET